MFRKRIRGAAMVEFALLAPFLVSLLTGTLWYGTRLVKGLEVTQVARDTASMYARGVDFSDPNNQRLVVRLGQDLGLQTSGGSGVIILSTMEYITQTQCDAYPNKGCNKGHWVYTGTVSFGDTNLRKSNFGAPTCTLGSDGSVATADSVTDTCAIVANFNLLATPSDGVDGFKPGQPVYTVEVYAQTGWGSGYGAYSAALF